MGVRPVVVSLALYASLCTETDRHALGQGGLKAAFKS
jgi:hypothetical protein